MPRIPRAVELVRVSTAGQVRDDTPEAQRRALDRLRVSRPCTVIERIEALGVSGALAERDRADLQRLRVLSAARAYDELRVWSVDRLTRSADLRDRAAIWGFALDAGAVIVDAGGRVLDPGDESGIGEIDYYLQTLFASRERAKIIARTGAGRRRAAEDGRLSQGSPPYGRRYDHATRSWVLVDEQAEVYRRAIDWALEGRSTRDIAAALNASGPGPTRGARWGDSTIKRMLSQTDTLVGRYHVCGVTTQIPPICDEVTAARLRRAVDSRRSSPGPRPHIEAALRGLLTCGECGERAHVLSDGVGRSARYSCPRPRSTCAGRSVRVPVADGAVRAALLGALSDPLVLRAAAERWCEEAPRTSADTADGVARDRARLAGQEARLLRLLDDGLVSEGVARERLGALRAAAAEVDARGHALALAEGAPSPAGHAAEVAERLAGVVRRASAARWRELLVTLCPSRPGYGARLTREGVALALRLPLGDPGEMVTSSANSAHFTGLLVVAAC